MQHLSTPRPSSLVSARAGAAPAQSPERAPLPCFNPQEDRCPALALRSQPLPRPRRGGPGQTWGVGKSSPALQAASPTARGTPSTPALECGRTGSSLRTAHAHVLLSRPSRAAVGRGCDPRGPWRGQACRGCTGRAGRRAFPPGSACESEGRRGPGQGCGRGWCGPGPPGPSLPGQSPAHLQDGAGTTRGPTSSSESRGAPRPGAVGGDSSSCLLCHWTRPRLRKGLRVHRAPGSAQNRG